MKPHRMSGWARILAIVALVPTLAWAQEGPGAHRAYIDPDEPVDRGSGIDQQAWEVMQVSGLAAASTLGTLWVNTNEDAYVWALRPVIAIPFTPQTPRVVTPEDPVPPPSVPPPPDMTFNSTLMHYDGASWSPVLDLEYEVAGTLFATGRKDVYATTSTPEGGIRLYHFNGNRWRAERLPDGVTGSVGDLVGDGSRVWFRAGNKILMARGRHWTTVYENDLLEPGHALVFLDRDHIIAPGINGQATWDGTSWTWTPIAWDMDVHGAWGARDAAGELHMFATGHRPDQCGMCVVQFVEDSEGSLHGNYVEAIPETGGAPLSGLGIEAWGNGVHDVYLVGVFKGVGLIEHFNGATWRKVFPVADLTEPTSVGGTREGDVWVALRDGRILRRMNPDPLVTDVAKTGPVNGITTAMGLTARRESPRSFVLEYGLEEGRDVVVSVFAVTGRRVAVLENGYREAGTHQVRWDARGSLPGVYFYRVRAGSDLGAGRLVVDR